MLQIKLFCCDDNINANGVEYNYLGKNNVLTKLRNLWTRNTFGIGCGAYVIYNSSLHLHCDTS